MGRFSACILSLLLLGAAAWTGACSGDGRSDAGVDAADGNRDAADGEDAGTDAGDAPTDGSDPVGDGGDDGCDPTGGLGLPCERDCQCKPGLACRGLPGEQVCAVPCATWEACQDALPGCQDARCEMATGACICPCQDGTCPHGQVCHLGACVGCALADHCRDLACSGDLRPTCLLAEERCVCGGTCRDGACDEAEAAALSCPTDCPHPCDDGEVLAHWCTDGQAVEWCRCEAGAWACADPTPACRGETACQRRGGMCVTGAADCYEGELSAEPQGCVEPQPACCLPLACTGPGESYYPMMGHCCPGLMPLTDTTPIAGWLPDSNAVTCATNCWALHCAPCGDGECQLHFGENSCVCPEDCPAPPYVLGCDPGMGDSGCGVAWCSQDADGCTQHTPACQNGACQIQASQHPDQRCSRVTRTCQP